MSNQTALGIPHLRYINIHNGHYTTQFSQEDVQNSKTKKPKIAD